MATRASAMVTTIDLDGPFFQRDPKLTFRQNVRTLMAAVAAEGEADVKAKLISGEGGRRQMKGITPSRVSGHVVGRVKSLSGKNWEVTAVVSINNSGLSKRQGTTLMAAGATVERRTKSFKKMTARMRKAKALNSVELLKGLR